MVFRLCRDGMAAAGLTAAGVHDHMLATSKERRVFHIHPTVAYITCIIITIINND